MYSPPHTHGNPCGELAVKRPGVPFCLEKTDPRDARIFLTLAPCLPIVEPAEVLMVDGSLVVAYLWCASLSLGSLAFVLSRSEQRSAEHQSLAEVTLGAAVVALVCATLVWMEPRWSVSAVRLPLGLRQQKSSPGDHQRPDVTSYLPSRSPRLAHSPPLFHV